MQQLRLLLTRIFPYFSSTQLRKALFCTVSNMKITRRIKCKSLNLRPPQIRPDIKLQRLVKVRIKMAMQEGMRSYRLYRDIDAVYDTRNGAIAINNLFNRL